MQKLKIENYIEIDGKDVPMDSLPKEKAEQISLSLQDAFMSALGYQRKRNTA